MKFTLVEEAIISVCKYETLTAIYFRRGMQLLCSILGASYSAVVSFFNFIAASRGGWGLFGSHTASTLNALSPRHLPSLSLSFSVSLPPFADVITFFCALLLQLNRKNVSNAHVTPYESHIQVTY